MKQEAQTTGPTNAPNEVPPQAWRAALDELMFAGLRPVALGVAILFGIFAIMHLLLLAPAVARLMTPLAGLTALSALGLYVFLNRSSTRLPVRFSHPLGALLYLGALANVLTHLYLTRSMLQSTNVALLLIAAGAFFLSTNWFVAPTALSLVGWAGLALNLPGGAAGVLSEAWGHFGFSIFSGAVLASLIHLTRLNSVKRSELLRMQEAYYRRELEVVLVTTEEAQRSLATSMAVGQQITSILDLDTLLHQVSILIQQRFNLYAVGIYLLDEGSMTLRAGAGKNGRPLAEIGMRLAVNQGNIPGWVIERRRPLRVDDVSSDNRHKAVETLPDTRSELALPLEMGTELLGVLDLQSAKIAAFHEENVPFLQLLADQVAIAINNASLYRAEKARLALTQNLYGIGRALSSTLNLNEVLDLILKHTVEIVHFDRAAVMMRKGEELEIAAARGFPAGGQNMRVSLKANDVFHEIYRSQQPLYLPDVSERPDWQHVEGLPMARAWLGIPLIHSDEVIGMLSLTRVTPAPFLAEEMTLAMTLAGQAAIAIRNASLYDQITRFNFDLENLVKQRTQDLRKAYEQLEKMDKVKSDFIGMTSHELRTPLTVVQGYSQMLLEEPLIKSEARYTLLVKGILSGVQRLLEIIESMLDVAKIDNRELALYPTPVPLPTMLQTVVEGLAAAAAERNITIEQDTIGLPSIQADVDGLRKVFYHLIINAIKFTPDGGKITLSGRAFEAGGFGLSEAGVEVIVHDSGIGIDAENQELIFNKFFSTDKISLHSTGKTKFKGKGPGLGLAIAKGIVEAHHGKIWVESPGHDETTFPGSRFHVVLPVRQ